MPPERIPGAEMTPENEMPADFPASLMHRVDALVDLGGPAMVAIVALSVLALALILWKLVELLRFGAFSGTGHAERAVRDWQAGQRDKARAALRGRRGLRAQLAARVMDLLATRGIPEPLAREETARLARTLLLRARAGLRGLELAVSIGPLLGLLGTVTGMIAAFQTLQETGARADPATLAGGIWEALLTTAAGMAVAIPAQIALTWFDSIIDRIRHDMEDQATRLFVAAGSQETLSRAFGETGGDPAAEEFG